ncbi:MAG: carbamate kinase [Ignavibacteria bacterium]|nr:carbamate kinase [Ignavibacteria bacterium]
MGSLAVIAVGGNALVKAGQHGSAEEQFANAMEIAGVLVGLLQSGYRLVITHGNGPQVGAALTRSEFAATRVYRLPYDCCVASTQGEIGYVLQYAIWQKEQQLRLHIPVATLITQVIVDSSDPAFLKPTKPIGPYYSREVADRYTRNFGWEFAHDAQGWRRVVASPLPREIVEFDVIRACVNNGMVVIAGGGGGVPVCNDHDISKGVEAVIDKDLTSALLARQLHADVLAIVTNEETVFLDYHKPTRRPLRSMNEIECRAHLAGGQFPPGSMGPKIQAALDFIQSGGREAVITDIAHLSDAILKGQAGTRIRMSNDLVGSS